MSSLLARIGAWFVEPPQPAADTPPPAPLTRFIPPTAGSAAAAAPDAVAPTTGPPSAAAPPPPTETADSSAEPPRSRYIRPTPGAGAAPVASPGVPPASGANNAPVQSPGVPAAAGAGNAPVRLPGVPPADPSTPSDVVGSAVVLGAPAAVVPVAAACAGELRARAKAAAAVLCLWRPGAPPDGVAPAESAVPSAESPAGATTPGARRLAARLTAHGLTATGCGRLAWVALEPDPGPAAHQVGRCLAVADAPVVLAVAGARPPAFEPLLADVDLAIAVLPPEIVPALRELALVTLRARARAILPPLPPGPPRWAAMAGLARLRSLPRGAS